MRQDRAQAPRAGSAVYAFNGNGAGLDDYQLAETWDRQAEALVLRSNRGALRVRFRAAKLHVAASAPEPVSLRVTVDDGPSCTISVDRPTLYTLLD